MRVRLVIRQRPKELVIQPGAQEQGELNPYAWLASHGRFVRDHVLPELLTNFEGKDIRRDSVRTEACKFTTWLIGRYVGDLAIVTFPEPAPPDPKLFGRR